MENIVPDAAGNFVIETLEIVSNEIDDGALVIIDPKRHRVPLAIKSLI
jgi:hypothetical protein